jgi:beta-phosphoglucomutase
MPLNLQKVKWNRTSHARIPPHSAHAPAPATPPSPTPSADAVTIHAILPAKPPTPEQAFAAWILGPVARVPKRSARAGLQGVIFDLDGVLVNTAEFHYQAWLRLARELGVPFDRQMNHAFRGVGRKECLEKLLGQHTRSFPVEEKHVLMERKNAYYLEQVHTLTPTALLPGAQHLVQGLRSLPDGGGEVRLAIVSASRNARLVIRLLGIEHWFDAIIDGADVTRGKPDPQGFLLAAERLRVNPLQCVVIEDADAGLAAARAAGMACVGVGEGVGVCDFHVDDVGVLNAQRLEEIVRK